MCDSVGVLYKGRAKVTQWKEEFAHETTTCRTLQDCMQDADCFIGLSSSEILSTADVKKMRANPLIFALAKPYPEIDPVEAKRARPDAIIATNRTDFPNALNNMMCFPFLFRGVLDTRAFKINYEMKMAVAFALAELAREPVYEEVEAA